MIIPQGSRLREAPKLLKSLLGFAGEWQGAAWVCLGARGAAGSNRREGGGLLSLPCLGLGDEPVLQRHGASPARTGGSCSVPRGPAHTALIYFLLGRNGGGWQLLSALEASGIAFLCASTQTTRVTKPCPSLEVGRLEYIPLWRNVEFPL